MEEHRNQKNLSAEQKTGFVLLLVFGILTVTLGFLQMRNTIYKPFVVSLSDEESLVNFDENARLQQIDTDHDGISDYEELFFYETSPYLPDTDSDGIDDFTEIEAGTSPLCPEGEVCNQDELDILLNNKTKSVEVENILNKDSSTNILGLVGGSDFGSTTTVDNFDAMSLANDPVKLRELLLSTGNITEEQLSQFSDEQLMTMTKEVAKEEADKLPSTNL